MVVHLPISKKVTANLRKILDKTTQLLYENTSFTDV